MPDIRPGTEEKMREELLKIIEKNSRIDLKELAVILGVEEIDVVNEMAAMEAEGIILRLSYADRLGKNEHRKGFRTDRGSRNTPARSGV